MPPSTSSSERPLPSSMPSCRLRLSPPVQVSTRSPRPLRPASVSRRPPRAYARREISAKPRVTSAAIALCPNPSDSIPPAAMAMTFFIAPPISTPTTSSLAYSRKRSDRKSCCTAATASARRPATTTAVGTPRATSAAKLGPESTVTGRAPPTSSAMTSDIRSRVPSSIPFAALMTVASDRTCGAARRSTWRAPCDGTAATTVHGTIDGILEDHRGVHGPRQLDAGQIHFVAAAGGHLTDESRIPPPTAAPLGRNGRDGWPAPCPQLPQPSTATGPLTVTRTSSCCTSCGDPVDRGPARNAPGNYGSNPDAYRVCPISGVD